MVLVDLLDCTETLDLLSQADTQAIAYQADVRSPEDWAKVASEVQARFGRADILVNNAGIYPLAAFEDLSCDTWRDVMATNLDAHFFGAKAFVPLMKAGGWGRIVNVASNSVGMTMGGISHYVASKMGVIGFVRGLANELGAYGITVNAVAPGAIQTPGTQLTGSVEAFDALANMQAIKRNGLPDDIAGPVLSLTSEDAKFVTGQTVFVDGGMIKN